MKVMNDKDIYDLKRKVFIDTVDLIKDFNIKKEKEEEQSKKDFSWKKLEKGIMINIWDEIETPNRNEEYDSETIKGSTFAYVESDSYNELDMDILLDLRNYIKQNDILPEGVDMSLKFYDSFYKYPILIKENSGSIFRRWQLYFTNIGYKDLEEINEKLVNYKSYDNHLVSIYSES